MPDNKPDIKPDIKIVTCPYCKGIKERNNTDFILWKDKHFENCNKKPDIMYSNILKILKAIFLQLDSYNYQQDEKLQMRDKSRELFKEIDK